MKAEKRLHGVVSQNKKRKQISVYKPVSLIETTTKNTLMLRYRNYCSKPFQKRKEKCEKMTLSKLERYIEILKIIDNVCTLRQPNAHKNTSQEIIISKVDIDFLRKQRTIVECRKGDTTAYRITRRGKAILKYLNQNQQNEVGQTQNYCHLQTIPPEDLVFETATLKIQA